MATRAEREQEEREQQAKGQTNPNDPASVANAEQQKQANEAAKQQKAYLDEMNRKIGEVVNTAASARDKDPQLLNYTVQALKNAAMQLESAQPPNISTTGQPQ